MAALVQDEGLSAGVMLALADHFLKYPSEEARGRFLKLYQRCPGGAVSFFNRYVLAEGSDVTREAAAAKIFDPQLDSYDREEALTEFVGKIPIKYPIVLETINKALEKFPSEDDILLIAVRALLEHGGEKERALAETTFLKIDPERDEYAFSDAVHEATTHLPQGSPTLARIAKAGLEKDRAGESFEVLWVACAKAGGEPMVKLLKAQSPEKAPELHALLLDYLKLRASPIGDPKKRIDAWAELVKRDVSLGWATDLLYAHFEEVAAADPPYAHAAFRKSVDTSYGIEPLEFLKKIGRKADPGGAGRNRRDGRAS